MRQLDVMKSVSVILVVLGILAPIAVHRMTHEHAWYALMLLSAVPAVVGGFLAIRVALAQRAMHRFRTQSPTDDIKFN